MTELIPWIGGLFTVTVVSLLAWLNTRKVYVPVERHWPSTVRLRFAEGVAEEVEYVVAQAWNIYTALGAPTGTVSYGGDLAPRTGEILVVPDAPDAGTAGQTTTKEVGGLVMWSKVFIGWPTLPVALQEIGHALGLGHIKNGPTGHCLHPTTKRLGTLTSGIQEAFARSRT